MVDPQANATTERNPSTARKADAPTPDRAVGSEPRSYQPDNDGHGAAPARQEAGQGLQAMSAARQTALAGAHLWSRSMGPFYAMQMEMMRWMDDLWRETTGSLRPANPSRALSLAPLVGLPPADVKETDKAYSLCIELPGLEKGDIDLSIQDEALVLTGHKAEERDEATTAYRLSERRFGRFERSFPLPADVDRERLDAVFKDGVLRVTLPRDSQLAAPARPRIPIKG